VDGQAVDWEGFFDGWVATVDWPGAPLFDKMAEAFPNALVLLSIREGRTGTDQLTEPFSR